MLAYRFAFLYSTEFLNCQYKYMKRFICAALLMVAITVQASAQKISESKLPEAVKKAFNAAHPKMKHTKWVIEDGNYEGTFVNEGIKITMVLDGSGKLVQTEVAIAESQMPQQALDYILSHYRGAKAKEIARITKANGDVVYESEIHKKKVLFDVNGRFLIEMNE